MASSVSHPTPARTASPLSCSAVRSRLRDRTMPRDLPIGNGSMLIAFDSHYRLADFFFPHVEMENHAAARFRFGVWADESLHWIEDQNWKRSLTYLRDTLVTDVTCDNDTLGLKLRC